jgi:hypothetical protein
MVISLGKETVYQFLKFSQKQTLEKEHQNPYYRGIDFSQSIRKAIRANQRSSNGGRTLFKDNGTSNILK